MVFNDTVKEIHNRYLAHFNFPNNIIGGPLMENRDVIKFRNTARFMFNLDKVIVLNRLNGQWIMIPKQCYEILQTCHDENLTIDNLNDMAFDNEDREYMANIISLLHTIECLSSDTKREVSNVSLAITHRCNLSCIHCMVSASLGEKTDIFDTETIYSFIDKIVSLNPNTIVITGGEPMLRPDFLRILNYLKVKHKGKITLMTNGTLFTAKNAIQVINMVDNIDISLDGADEPSCAVVRGEGVFGKVVSNIKMLQNQGFSKISLSMVLTNNNSRYVPKFLELNKELNTYPMLRALSYEGRALDHKEELDRVFNTNFDSTNKTNDVNEPRGCSCTAGYNQLTIEANGDIFPCNLFVTSRFKLGNIKETDSLHSIMEVDDGEFISKGIQQYEPNKFEKCRDCNVNYFCWSCLYPMYKLSNEEFEERCHYKKQVLSTVWE